MASKQKNSGTVRVCSPREFEALLSRTLNKPGMQRPTSLRLVWSRPAPPTEVDPFESDLDETHN